VQWIVEALNAILINYTIWCNSIECIVNLFKIEDSRLSHSDNGELNVKEKAVMNKERKQITCANSKCGKRFHQQRSNQHYCNKYCRWNHWKEDNPRKTVRVDPNSEKEMEGKRVISVTEEEFQLFQEWKKSRALKATDSKSKVKPASRIEMEI